MAKYRHIETALIASVILRIPESMTDEEVAKLLEERTVLEAGRTAPGLQVFNIKVEEAYIASCTASDIGPYHAPVYSSGL